MTTNWIWNKQEKSIGSFFLGASVKSVLALLSKLERYEYEEYDTYVIEDSNWSKFFVMHGNIVSIQCAHHFIVDGVDVIGKNIDDCEKALNEKFFSIILMTIIRSI